MLAKEFYDCLKAEFFTGVPDSQLGEFCDYLMRRHGLGVTHIIAANEGACVGIAAGYHLATGKIPVVYLQNSGLGNCLNPTTSLLHPKVYGIPCIFLVGWRGEPGVPDEPQHAFQGESTLTLLKLLEIETIILGPDTSPAELKAQLQQLSPCFAVGKSVAIVIKKQAICFDGGEDYRNLFALSREEALREVVKAAGEDRLVCTTGKASRELFEIREVLGQSHDRDFLTVGAMGHASALALGLALSAPEQRIWCVDGDGAALMHLGTFGTIGERCPRNLVHILMNNQAHESVGGMPTTAQRADFVQIARALGYPFAMRVWTREQLEKALAEIQVRNQLAFLEIMVAIGSRRDLGRPTLSPTENKQRFMAGFLSQGEYRKKMGDRNV